MLFLKNQLFALFDNYLTIISIISFSIIEYLIQCSIWPLFGVHFNYSKLHYLMYYYLIIIT